MPTRIDSIRARLAAEDVSLHPGLRLKPDQIFYLLRVADAAKAFLDRWDEVLPQIKAEGTMAWLHGFRYEGPTTEEPIQNLRNLLAEEEESEDG